MVSVVLLLSACAGRVVAQEPSVRLVNDAEQRELIVVIGPVDVPAGSRPVAQLGPEAVRDPHAVHGGAILPPVSTVRIPLSAYLTGFSYELRDGAGQVVPRDLVHHLNLINPDFQELFLPISQRMLAVGRETGAQSMPSLLMGYPVPEGTSMVVTAMLHNPTEQSYDDVELLVRLRYVPAGRPWPLFNVYPFQMDVAFPVGDKSFNLPPGRSTWSFEARPSMEGRIMVIGGHLHDHAVSLRFEDVTDGRVIWEAAPILDSAGRLVGVPIGQLYRKLGAKVTPEHLYRVSVTYENPTGDTLYAGGMGVVAGVFMQTAGGMWPRADKADDLYVMDWLHYTRQVSGSADVLRAALTRFKEDGTLPAPVAPAAGHAHQH
jgi:hypothetical protein